MKKGYHDMRKEVIDNMITSDKVSNGITKIDTSQIVYNGIDELDFLKNIKNITSPKLRKIQHRIKDELLEREDKNHKNI